MSKYKLIKKYPGSPELGTIAEKGMGIKFTHPNGKVTGACYSGEYNFKTLIQDNPEFWEEVIEKDYEILSLRIRRSISHEVSIMSSFSDDYIISILNCEGNHIHSVRRLSDGEIFTVGDKIKSYPDDKGFVIKYIWIDTSGSLLLADYNKGSKSNRSAYLSSSKKMDPPLFTTVDGVDIYEGDYVCWISNIINIDSYINDYRLADKAMFKDGSVLYFSTREKAEEYIIMNKPCLSIQDLLDTKGVYFEGESKLKELVKSKL